MALGRGLPSARPFSRAVRGPVITIRLLLTDTFDTNIRTYADLSVRSSSAGRLEGCPHHAALLFFWSLAIQLKFLEIVPSSLSHCVLAIAPNPNMCTVQKQFRSRSQNGGRPWSRISGVSRHYAPDDIPRCDLQTGNIIQNRGVQR